MDITYNYTQFLSTEDVGSYERLDTEELSSYAASRGSDVFLNLECYEGFCYIVRLEAFEVARDLSVHLTVLIFQLLASQIMTL